MRRFVLTAVVTLLLPAATGAQSLTRGRYIVERAGMCNDWHTPRGGTGQLIRGRSPRGARIGLRPMNPMLFSEHAPPLAGLPGHDTPARMVTFLETGKRPDGSLPKPPMPPYRLSREAALAVTASLKTLKRE